MLAIHILTVEAWTTAPQACGFFLAESLLTIINVDSCSRRQNHFRPNHATGAIIWFQLTLANSTQHCIPDVTPCMHRDVMLLTVSESSSEVNLCMYWNARDRRCKSGWLDSIKGNMKVSIFYPSGHHRLWDTIQNWALGSDLIRGLRCVSILDNVVVDCVFFLRYSSSGAAN